VQRVLVGATAHSWPPIQIAKQGSGAPFETLIVDIKPGDAGFKSFHCGTWGNNLTPGGQNPAHRGLPTGTCWSAARSLPAHGGTRG